MYETCRLFETSNYSRTYTYSLVLEIMPIDVSIHNDLQEFIIVRLNISKVNSQFE